MVRQFFPKLLNFKFIIKIVVSVLELINVYSGRWSRSASRQLLTNSPSSSVMTFVCCLVRVWRLQWCFIQINCQKRGTVGVRCISWKNMRRTNSRLRPFRIYNYQNPLQVSPSTVSGEPSTSLLLIYTRTQYFASCVPCVWFVKVFLQQQPLAHVSSRSLNRNCYRNIVSPNVMVESSRVESSPFSGGPGSNLGSETGNPDWVFRGFPQSLQANTGIVP
jgi:hypothetical protein